MLEVLRKFEGDLGLGQLLIRQQYRWNSLLWAGPDQARSGLDCVTLGMNDDDDIGRRILDYL
jgi:hypothetical protein